MSRRLLDKNFCVLPWTGFELEPDGNVKNCIISKNRIGNIHQNSIEDIIQSKTNLNIKTQMLNNEFPKNCEGCYYQEQHRPKNFDNISSRLYYAKEVGPYVNKTLLDNKDNFNLKHVDIRWNNRCNQACVYCSPEYSSKWAKELNVKDTFNKNNINKVKKYIFENIKSLKNVYLAGGEPLLMNENKEFLELLLKENKDVHLRVNTNLSSTKTGVFELICKFKNVHWTVSLETIEEEYEYVRFGGKWKNFLNNLTTISKLKEHKISFNMLHFILNYMSVFDCIKFLQGLGFHNNSFVLGPLYTPSYLNIKNLPYEAKKQVKRKLEDLIDEKPGFLLQNSLENVLNYLTADGFHANIELVRKMLEKMDTRRNLDSKKIFPKLYKEVFDK